MLDAISAIDLANSAIDDGMSGKYLTFQVDDGDYGIEISYVIEIIEMQEIAPVPHTPAYIKGITNLRGTIVPIIDLRLRFGHAETVYTDRTCIIVLSMDEVSVGFIVDEVQEVAGIDDGNIQPPPKSTGSAARSYFVKAIGVFDGQVKQLIDIDRVFDMGDLAGA